jgi:hypothetical protein
VSNLFDALDDKQLLLANIDRELSQLCQEMREVLEKQQCPINEKNVVSLIHFVDRNRDEMIPG